MNTTNMPGFTAEASLAKSGGHYSFVPNWTTGAFGQALIPQLRLVGGPTADTENTADSCDTRLGLCEIVTCRGLPEPAHTDCRRECFRSYEECILATTDTIPVPYPVIDRSRSNCLQGCRLGCLAAQDPADRLACMTPCWFSCNAQYPKPR